MADCLDKQYAEMLMAYEMGLLSEEKELLMEQHLFNCDVCFSEVKQFSDRSELLRHSPALREAMKRLSVEKSEGRKRANLTRLLMAAALIVIVSAPVYYFGLGPDSPDTIQRLELVPVRGTGGNVLYLGQGGAAEIQFVIQSPGVDQAFIVTISSRAGATVFVDSSYTDVSQSGRGIIQLPVDKFEPGFYTLTVTDPSTPSSEPLRQYSFRVR